MLAWMEIDAPGSEIPPGTTYEPTNPVSSGRGSERWAATTRESSRSHSAGTVFESGSTGRGSAGSARAKP